MPGKKCLLSASLYLVTSYKDKKVTNVNTFLLCRGLLGARQEVATSINKRRKGVQFFSLIPILPMKLCI